MLNNNLPYLCRVNKFSDERGSMSVLFEGHGFNAKIIKMTKSNRGVLRGFHYQTSPLRQSKMIIVVEGKIQDVCLEMDNDVPTGNFVDNIIEADSDNASLILPNNWAHAYLTLSEYSKVLYLCDEIYGSEISLNPLLNYRNWALPQNSLLISKKDLAHA